MVQMDSGHFQTPQSHGCVLSLRTIRGYIVIGIVIPFCFFVWLRFLEKKRGFSEGTVRGYNLGQTALAEEGNMREDGCVLVCTCACNVCKSERV